MKSPKNQPSLTSKSITKHIIPQNNKNNNQSQQQQSPSSSLRITIQIEKPKTNQIKEPIVKRNEILPANLGEINFL
jgi:hypothetical protein